MTRWFRPLVDGPWGSVPLLTVVGGMCALTFATAYNLARFELDGAQFLYWIAYLVAVVPIVAVLILPDRPRRERFALVSLLGVAMLFPTLLRSPTGFAGYDELLHLRGLTDVLKTEHLFQSNPLLSVGPYFPGLEIVAAAVAQVSGADPYAAAVVLLGFIRVIFAGALFVLYEEISSSPRLAGLAAAIYIVNPSFVFFDSGFAYESLALPFVPMILWAAARWARRSADRRSLWLVLVLLVMLCGVIVSHHVTSYALAILLITWTALHILVRRNDRYDGSMGIVALICLLGAAAWLLAIASLTLGYLLPPLSAAVQQVIRLIVTGEGRELFQSATGQVASLWERATGIAASAILLAWLPVGLVAIWLRLRDSSLALLMFVVSLGYPASLVLRFTVSGAEAAARSSSIVYLGLAFVVASGFLAIPDVIAWGRAHVRMPGWISAALGRIQGAPTPWRAIVVASFGILVIGGAIVGSSPATRLPGPYLVEADARSIDAESIAAANWTRESLGENRRIAADRVNRVLLGAYGVQDVVFHHSTSVDSWPVFLSPALGENERARLKRLGLEYVLIDRRLSQGLPVFGFYYEEGEIAHGGHKTPISPTWLGKWDRHPRVDRVFDSGSVQIYDVRRVSHDP